MKKILTFGLAASALLIGSTQAQAATFIDTFNSGETSLEVSNNTMADMMDTEVQNGINGVFGRSRDITFTFDNVDPLVQVGISTARIDLFGRGNQYTHENGSGVDSTVKVKYDGFAQTNLQALGDRFELDVIAFEPAGSSIVGISVEDAFGGRDLVTTGTLDPDPSFAFTDFSGVDFSAVTAITLQTTGFFGEDITLDNLRVEGETTPEPAAVLGLLLSLGCGALSKKKKQA